MVLVSWLAKQGAHILNNEATNAVSEWDCGMIHSMQNVVGYQLIWIGRSIIKNEGAQGRPPPKECGYVTKPIETFVCENDGIPCNLRERGILDSFKLPLTPTRSALYVEQYRKAT